MTAIYAIRSAAGPIKVGISKSPEARLAILVNQQPFGAEIIHTLQVEDDNVARAIERAAHELLAAKHRRGEWFDVSEGEAIAAIQRAIALVEEGYRAGVRIAGPGRPPLNLVKLTLRVPASLGRRIDALVGENKRALFIREAVERELARLEQQKSLSDSKPE